jgi:hypothetical protein
VLVATWVVGSVVRAYGAADADGVTTIEAVARGIEELAGRYPQLVEFSISKNLDRSARRISYAYHTHAAEPRGGWTSGVPSPDADGVWFFIDVHAPDSRAEIHTQPVTAAFCLGENRVSFLLLEGQARPSLEPALWAILRDHGVVPCARTGSPR